MVSKFLIIILKHSFNIAIKSPLDISSTNMTLINESDLCGCSLRKLTKEMVLSSNTHF